MCWREAISSLHIPVGVKCFEEIASPDCHQARNDVVGLQTCNDVTKTLLIALQRSYIIKLGLYDGFPKTFTQQNIKTGIHFNDGIFSIAEYEKKINSNKIKLGLYNHSGSLSNTDSSVIINPHNGIYSIVCSEIVRLKKHII